MARKNLFAIDEADTARAEHRPAEPAAPEAKPRQPRQAYREGKRAIMFFVSDEEFSHMHVILARLGRKKVQTLMQELLDDWFRRQAAPRLRE
jgi:hypothetical protein